MQIEFTINIHPMPWQRPRFNKNGVVYETKAFKEYKQMIAEAAKNAMGERPPFNKPVGIALGFHKINLVTSRNFGDIDNLAKAVLDAFNGIVFTDDKLVTALTVAKRQRNDEYIRVAIYP